jgi:RNA polymerase sigma-70 factor (ECF subfamily)
VAILARPGLLPQITDPEAGAEAVVHVVATKAQAPASPCADKARLTALYRENGARVHRFLRDLLGDTALAADATQETFVRAYRKLPDLEESVRVVPWLFGIARNVSLELRKARYRAGRHLVALAGPLPDGVAAGASPESDYLGREALRVVGAALSQLSEERRAMLLLRLDHGLSYDDIALTMNTSLARVKIEIFRARETLRNTMAEYEQS